MFRRGNLRGCLWLVAFIISALHLRAQTVRVASYNLENYLDTPTETRPHPKSSEARSKIREGIRALKPDVLAVQEIGSLSALNELRASLSAEGLDFPFWEWVSAFDTNIHVAVLSRFPFAARNSRTNESYLLGGRRFWFARGIAEVRVRPSPSFAFTLLTTHLKSKRPVPDADEAEQRLEEAKILRRVVSSILSQDPEAAVVVAGDFNDNKDSAALKTIIGRGRLKLTDTRPAERNADMPSTAGSEPRAVTWTHFYAKEDSYSRIDYILLSPAMSRRWLPAETFVLAIPGWGVGSDHRPIIATFACGPR